MSSTQKAQVVDKQFMPESKERQFQTIVKAFENQQWAKGLKLVEPLLKEFPENGKLISMKAILKYNVDKNVAEAEAGLKRGMMLGRRTSLCWHLYGIFQRTQKKYAEAKKAFQLAHSLDPMNIQIIVDLSDLQIQVRDYSGYRISKQKLMNERSGNGTFWVGFIMGAYLEKKYELCIDIITSYLPSIEQKPCYQIQELIFLQAACNAHLKKWDKAIESIQNGMKFILNENRAMELLAVYYLQQQDFAHSQEIVSTLLSMNCDSKYYCILNECNILKRSDLLSETELPSFSSTLSSTEKETLLEAYKALFALYPKAIFLPLVLMNLMEGEVFATFLTQRTYTAIRKGIPSFFQSLNPIISTSSSKLATLKTICLDAYAKVKENNKLEEQEEEPFVLLWLVLLLAEIEDYEHHYKQALVYVDEAIAHTPTCYDAYRLKSKILKHAGYLKQSEAMIEFSYNLDKFDRYMNTKCVKACLKACSVEKADDIISYWTRSNVPCRIDLESLEACWFELRCGTAYLRRKDYPHAMKLYNNVLKHFETFVAEQFDFHGYVLRKNILTTYASFLQSLDNLYNHRYFKTAAIGALKCACAVFDTPIIEEEYKKNYPLTKVMAHKKGAEYTDDKDPDGLQLIQDPKLFASLQTTVVQLLQFAKNDREAMYWVFEWANRKKDTKICNEAIENLSKFCNATADAAYCLKQLTPEIKVEESIDMSSIHNRTLMAKVVLLDNPTTSVFDLITKNWETVKCDPIEDFVECYKILRQNDSSRLSDYIHLVQTFYPGFEETIQCWIICFVCWNELYYK